MMPPARCTQTTAAVRESNHETQQHLAAAEALLAAAKRCAAKTDRLAGGSGVPPSAPQAHAPATAPATAPTTAPTTARATATAETPTDGTLAVTERGDAGNQIAASPALPPTNAPVDRTAALTTALPQPSVPAINIVFPDGLFHIYVDSGKLEVAEGHSSTPVALIVGSGEIVFVFPKAMQAEVKQRFPSLQEHGDSAHHGATVGSVTCEAVAGTDDGLTGLIWNAPFVAKMPGMLNLLAPAGMCTAAATNATTNAPDGSARKRARGDPALLDLQVRTLADHYKWSNAKAANKIKCDSACRKVAEQLTEDLYTAPDHRSAVKLTREKITMAAFADEQPSDVEDEANDAAAARSTHRAKCPLCRVPISKKKIKALRVEYNDQCCICADDKVLQAGSACMLSCGKGHYLCESCFDQLHAAC